MKILFLTHYFPPEGNAPANRVFEFARRWVTAGHEVTVITGFPNVPNGIVYEGYRNQLRQIETFEGIRVVRVWTYIAANKGTVRRTLNYISFMISALVAGLFVKRPDIVIATSPQLFCGLAGAAVARLRRLPFILEIRDIWPESIKAVEAVRGERVMRWLEWLERRLYRAAEYVVTVGDGYKRQLLARGVEPERVSVVSNGIDPGFFASGKPWPEFRAKHGLAGSFVCAFVGTIGMACGLEVVLDAARILAERGRIDIVFLLVGDGAERANLEAKAREMRLGSVVFTGLLARQDIPRVLASSSACLVHLRKKELFKTVMPTKILEAAAAAKPILVGVSGDAAELVRKAGAGIYFEPGNAVALADAVERLVDNPGLAAEMGRAGRERICGAYDYDKLATEYAGIISQVFNRR